MKRTKRRVRRIRREAKKVRSTFTSRSMINEPLRIKFFQRTPILQRHVRDTSPFRAARIFFCIEFLAAGKVYKLLTQSAKVMKMKALDIGEIMEKKCQKTTPWL